MLRRGLAISLTADRAKARRLDEAMQRLPRALRTEAHDEMQNTLEEARAWMIAERLSGPPSEPGVRKTSRILGQVSGNLVASIRTSIVARGKELIGRLFVDRRFRAARYAWIHEFGGVIRARVKQFMTLPLTIEAALRPASRMAGLFVIESKAGNLFLARREGSGVGSLVRHFLLRKEVTMPARPFMGPTRRRFQPLLRKRLAGAMRRALQSSFRR